MLPPGNSRYTSPMAYKTGNPALKSDTFNGLSVAADEPAMTMASTVNKIVILMILTILSAFVGWQLVPTATNATISSGAALVALGAPFLGLALAIAIIFKKQWAPALTPVYVMCEGLFLGVISKVFNAQYQGIALTAVILTFGILACMLVIYQSGLIRVTEHFRMAVAAATGAIAVYYIFNLLFGLFAHHNLPLIWDSGSAGIIFSIIVVIVAALNLVLDFDFIEQGARHRLPKYMEWYAGFGLMVTVIWLYLEILRLLAKSRSN